MAAAGASGDRDATVLCTAAAERARLLGHVLGPWEVADEAAPTALRARCSRCGRVAFVRSEPGLGGIAGEALTERCAGTVAH